MLTPLSLEGLIRAALIVDAVVVLGRAGSSADWILCQANGKGQGRVDPEAAEECLSQGGTWAKGQAH